MSLVPHPSALSVGVPQPCTPGMLPSLVPVARHDLRPAACLPTAPWRRSTGPRQGSNTTPFCRLAGLARETQQQRDVSLVPVHGWILVWRGRGRGGTLRRVAGRQVATGAGSSSASPAQPTGTSYPCPGGKGGFAEPQGCGDTPSPGRCTHGCTGAGWCLGDTVPGAMLVPAWGAEWPAACGRWAEHCSRMAAASSCSRSVGCCHGIAPSGQAVGGAGPAILGSPRHPSCRALCSTEPALGQGSGCCPGQH